jgi:hypothetical protein
LIISEGDNRGVTYPPSLPGMEGQEDMSTTVRKKARLSRQRAVRKKARLSGVTHWAAHK